MLFDKAWEEGNVAAFKGLMDIVLEAPIRDGGLPSEWFDKYHKTDDSKREVEGEVR